MKNIEYASKSWNPFTGCMNYQNGVCAVGQNCWALRFAKRFAGKYGYDKDDPFKPTFHEDKLNIPLKIKKPTIFAACFMGDISFCKPEWINKIFEIIKQCPHHRFIFLTKVPEKLNYQFPDNCAVGVTVNRSADLDRIRILKNIVSSVKFVSFEPVYERIKPDLSGIQWIMIGAQTGPKEFQPKKEWIDDIIESARNAKCNVFIKDNLDYETKIVEFPSGLYLNS